MLKLSEDNRGLLYSAEPEYLWQLSEDDVAHGSKPEGLEPVSPNVWQTFSALQAKLAP